MLERFDELARQSLFAAREVVSRRGAEALGLEHLILGIWEADPDVIDRLVPTPTSSQILRAELQSAASGPQPFDTSAELPFTPAAADALRFASIQAEDFDDKWVTPAHILLGVLHEAESSTAKALVMAGVHADAVRANLRERRSER